MVLGHAASRMTDEKSDKSKSSEHVFESDPPGHLSEDTTIILKNADQDPQSNNKGKQHGRALGTTIGGHYRLESRIGSGGSSAVYLATDVSLNRKVAVKLLLSGAHYSDEERLRFEREGRAVGALDHPNIVRIFEFNTTEDEEPFLVMEYLQGKSLAEILKEKGSLRLDEFLAWMKQVVQALSYAHKHGIVHRDIKSSNIVIVQNERGESSAKVVDFGLARPDEEAGKGLTLTGTIFGSPYYMSPEQCRGERVDARSDIYSLGCVMYECLNGHVPFDGASMIDTFRMHLEEQAKPFAASLKNVQNAADIEKVVFKCLAKHPVDRYQDADRLEQEFDSLEKNLRSGILVNTLALGRRLKAGYTKRFGKYARAATVSVAAILIATGALTLRPQLITDHTDKYWSELDLKAQHAFDDGDLEAAKKYYDEALNFAGIMPVTQKEVREREELIGKLDIAYATENAEEKKLLKDKIRDLEKDTKRGKLVVTIAELLQSVKLLQHSKDPAQEENAKRQAAFILNSANDAVDILIFEGHLLEASDLLQAVYDKTTDFLPDNDPVIPRTLLNLVAMYIDTDPQKSFIYMTKCYGMLNEEGIPPLAKARFLSDLGYAYLVASHPESGIPLINKALEIYRYENALSGIGAGEAFLRLAESQIRIQRASEAASSLARAEQAFEFGEKNPSNTLRCALTHAEILLANGQIEPALEILNKQLDQQERVMPKRDKDLTVALYWKARLLMQIPYTDANAKVIKNLASRAIAIWERTEHNAFAGTMAITLGDFQANNRRLVDAEKSYAKAIQVTSAMRSVDNYSKVSMLNNMGEILMRRSQFDKAYEVLKRSEAALVKANAVAIGVIVGIQPQTEKYLYSRLAECAERLGKREEALKYKEKVESSF